MDVKQEPIDHNEEVIKIEPGPVSDEMEEHYWSFTNQQTFINDHNYCVLGDTDNICEYQTTGRFINLDTIKQECELPKIDGSDFLKKNEYDSVPENVHNFPIKKELENSNEVEDSVGDIKPNVSKLSQYIQFKDDSELLTSHCDLPTLKCEVTDVPDYFSQPCSSKQTLIKLKSSKNTSRNVSKQKKRCYPWSVCQKNYPSSQSELNQTGGHFKKQLVLCKLCGKLFIDKLEFFRHYFTHSLKNKKRKESENINEEIRNDHDYTKMFTMELKRSVKQQLNKYSSMDLFKCERFKCDLCFKKFKHRSKLTLHNMTVHINERQFKCNICTKVFKYKSNLQGHLITHIYKKPFKCDICSKHFYKKSTLLVHLRIHTSEKPFKCSICHEQFSQKNHLKTHLLIDNKEKPFKCNICFKEFNQKCGLRNHLVTHINKKPLISSKKFTHISNLNQHFTIHSQKPSKDFKHGNEIPFKCDTSIFPKEYKYKHKFQIRLRNYIDQNPFKRFQESNFPPNLKIHHNEKSFHCDLCSKEFYQNSRLQRHLITHTNTKPFECDICFKKFNQKSNLKTHSITHTDLKPFKCDICSKEFNLKANLQKHFIIHTDEKPFKCDICFKEFNQKSSLQRHSNGAHF